MFLKMKTIRIYSIFIIFISLQDCPKNTLMIIAQEMRFTTTPTGGPCMLICQMIVKKMSILFFKKQLHKRIAGMN